MVKNTYYCTLEQQHSYNQLTVLKAQQEPHWPCKWTHKHTCICTNDQLTTDSTI